MWKITCKHCKKSTSADLWLESALGIPYPKETYQCPECKIAFKREHGVPIVFKSGDKEMIIPGKITLTQISTIYY